MLLASGHCLPMCGASEAYCNVPNRDMYVQLTNVFAAFGHVTATRLVRDRGSTLSRGFCFVEFSNTEVRPYRRLMPLPRSRPIQRPIPYRSRPSTPALFYCVYLHLIFMPSYPT